MRVFILISALCFSLSTIAEETTKLSAFELFEEQKATILQDIKDDTIYSEIEYSDVKLVKDSLNQMSLLLDGITDVAELTEDQRAELFNNQGLVNTILTMAENDSRMVCRRKGRLGTNFKTTTCETVRDRRERQEADRIAIDSFIKARPITSN
jgi:hypothetical protein